jgi:oligopeptide transport system permease protein
MKKFLNFSFILPFSIFIILVLVSFLFPFFSEKSFDSQDISQRLLSPSLQYWFGTDVLGRDNFVRTIYALRYSLILSFVSSFVSFVFGFSIGTFSGLFEGTLDQVLMRVLDVLYSLPTLLVAIFIMVIFGQGFSSQVLALSSLNWIYLARLVRILVIQTKNLPHVEAALASGATKFYVLIKHIIPLIFSQVIVTIFFQIPNIILLESFLSFLGIGVQPPEVSLGILIADGFRGIKSYPYLIFYPGLVFFMLLLSLQFIGDRLRDYFDPKMI